jgi:hypothetical protein
MRSFIVISSIIVITTIAVDAQDTIKVANPEIHYGLVVDGDTVLVSDISEVVVFPSHEFKNKWQWMRYRRLVKNIKKVYPYAKLAKKKYDEVSANLLTMETEKEQKEYLKQVEQELKDEFEDDLKKLTISQGRILLKLIDREIGETSYDLLKEFRGTFTAFFWQTIAKLFGNNLKAGFDAEGEDKLINEIIVLIDHGLL